MHCELRKSSWSLASLDWPNQGEQWAWIDAGLRQPRITFHKRQRGKLSSSLCSCNTFPNAKMSHCYCKALTNREMWEKFPQKKDIAIYNGSEVGFIAVTHSSLRADALRCPSRASSSSHLRLSQNHTRAAERCKSVWGGERAGKGHLVKKTGMIYMRFEAWRTKWE